MRLTHYILHNFVITVAYILVNIYNLCMYSPKINFVQDLNTDPKLASEDNNVDVITNVVRVVNRYSHNLEPD
ncbi:hypothetical protein Hanom_Chr10g00927051 [Helianthus anomalus]